MSSSPPAETRTVVRRKGFRVWSLRARLLGTLVLLLAVVCAVIGVATEVVVYQVQVRKLDKRLAAAGLRTEDAFGEPREGPKDGHDRPPPIQGPGTLAAIIDDGHIYQAQVLDIGGHWQPLSAADASVLSGLPIDGRAHTRTLGARGDYRLLASGAPNGSVIITGLSLDDVYAMQYELAVIEVGVGLAALLIAGLACAVIMRTTLRPLRRVAGIAGRVAELPLDRGEVALSLRVSDVDTDPRTEVGRRGAVRAAGQRDASTPLRGRRQPRAAYALGRDPRVRRARPPHRRQRYAGGGTCAAARGVRGCPDDRDGRGSAAPGSAGRRTTAGRRAGRPVPARHRRRQRRARRRANPPLAAQPARGVGRRDGRRCSPAPGAGEPARERPYAHAARYHRDHEHCRGRSSRGLAGDRRRPRHRGRPAARGLRPLLAWRHLPLAGGRQHRPGARDRRRSGGGP